ncbi:MAG: DUF1003 domain-containing protein [Bacteroidota bacterium]
MSKFLNPNIKKNETNQIEESLYKKLGNLNELEQEVVDSLRSGDILAENTEDELEQQSTFGERIADKIAEFGGSWKFILMFLGVLISWIIINVFFFHEHGFDPYPFILLNLVLSCLAAFQAPVIMMSQNRQSFKDRERANHAYQVNLRSELEISILHEKMDVLMNEIKSIHETIKINQK